MKRKEKNIAACLKTVRGILAVIEKTMETACKAYADAFAVVSSRLSCSKFKQTVYEFRDAAKQYANGKRNNAISVIVSVISGMADPRLED
ncbi:hypothetical protein F0310_05475 (plasmid) [Borrelia sp. A-FGy1]|uniref:hypothetical protein n=1 Tax=Borrelia sp. A-FGy1 TaxID=2608247 RepID=UPI0015F63B21|nr:hypothetical protein [Borrelia sp. A-FGy1]QMU99861.1 hypothetical protein F0310_05475 [Borrelia sp. A-FGy1]